MPAYNASKTLGNTYHEIDHSLVDEVILVDDCSSDDTFEIANQLVVEFQVFRQYGFSRLFKEEKLAIKAYFLLLQ